MTQLSDLLKKLTREQRLGIHHMFELGEPYFVILNIDGVRYFIGVHLHSLDHLKPLEKLGSWSMGLMP